MLEYLIRLGRIVSEAVESLSCGDSVQKCLETGTLVIKPFAREGYETRIGGQTVLFSPSTGVFVRLLKSDGTLKLYGATFFGPNV